MFVHVYPIYSAQYLLSSSAAFKINIYVDYRAPPPTAFIGGSPFAKILLHVHFESARLVRFMSIVNLRYATA